MLKITVLKNRIQNNDTFTKGLDIFKNWMNQINFPVEVTVKEIDVQFSGLAFENSPNSVGNVQNGACVEPNQILNQVDGTEDIAALVYDWDKVTPPKPTNPIQHAVRKGFATPIQVPEQWYGVIYPEVFAQFFMHEVCHAVYYLTGKAAEDKTHYEFQYPQFNQKQPYEFYQFLLNGLKPYWDAYGGASKVSQPSQPVQTTGIVGIPSGFQFNKNLFYNNKNSDVVMLQRFLISQGCLAAGNDTGNFKNLTLAAVKLFQSRNGITPTGNVAEITRGKINSLLRIKKNSISESGIELIKKFEGCILHPYQDVSGYWTIGYGNRFINGVSITANTPPLTQQQADNLLRDSLKSYEATVQKAITVSLKQNQYDALVSFCYNLGNVNGLKDAVNNGTITRQDFLKYVYSKGKVIQGLIDRRNKEADLYFN